MTTGDYRLGDTQRTVLMKSDDAGVTWYPVQNPVGAGGAGGAGTEYTEGDVDTTITGTAIMWEDSPDTLRAVSALKPLPVNTGNVVVVDGGGSLTVDGTVGISGSVPVTDNSGSLTVDAPVGTPVFVRLSDGSSAIATLPVSLASVPSHNVTNAGTFAVQADTELPAAAALADAAANPTTPIVGSANLMFNGTTWDRARGDTTNGLDVDVTRVSGSVSIAPQKGSSCTPAQVACSTTSATLKASNASRKGLVIYNDAAQALYVKFGATASSTSFTVKMPAATVYEISGPEIYTGVVDGVLASGTGNAYVSEW